MIGYLCLAIGLVLILEGLAYALAPSFIERLLEAMREIPIETRRQIGLFCVVIGALFLWMAQGLGL